MLDIYYAVWAYHTHAAVLISREVFLPRRQGHTQHPQTGQRQQTLLWFIRGIA